MGDIDYEEACDRLIDRARSVDVRDVAARLLDSARPAHKFSCPVCPSSDALHVYEDGAYCHSTAHPIDRQQMDAIELVQQAGAMDFKGAVEWLTGEQWPDPDGSDTSDRRPAATPAEPVKTRADVDEGSGSGADGATTVLLERMIEVLELDERGAAYMESRGLSAMLAVHWGIVSCSRGEWGAWAAKADEGLLRASGLVTRKDSLHPFYDHFLAIPYWGYDGTLETVRFRTTGDEAPKMLSVCRDGPVESAAPYAVGAVDTALSEGLPLFVVEGELDALSIIRAGYPAVATYTASVWRASWCQQWEDLHCVVAVAEGDQGGDHFVERVLETATDTLGEAWASARLWTAKIQEKGEDANDLLQRGVLAQRCQDIVSHIQSQSSVQ